LYFVEENLAEEDLNSAATLPKISYTPTVFSDSNGGACPDDEHASTNSTHQKVVMRKKGAAVPPTHLRWAWNEKITQFCSIKKFWRL